MNHSSRFSRRTPQHSEGVLHDAIWGSRAGWVPDEVSPESEEAERRRTSALAYEFFAVLEPEWADRLVQWEDAQRRLWNESVKRRKRSCAPSWETFKEEISEESKWLTLSRRKYEFLADVPRSMQEALMGQLAGKLKQHYFQRGEPPERWSETTLEFPLLRLTSANVRTVSTTSIKLPRIGVVELQGSVPLPKECEVTKVHFARNDDGRWGMLVYAITLPGSSTREESP